MYEHIEEWLQLMEEIWQSLPVIPETNGNLLKNDEFSSISTGDPGVLPSTPTGLVAVFCCTNLWVA